ncbi:hypothetical protein J7E71_25150 [Mesobacillus foraminis]|uniref:hypothetical protein n=1 Tax=Mesobacillus foraminis TaxID=279826 RepID=UPI001BEBB81C|nr:hypothetical protein [Mesobacillus foraminis]MBT2759162.1 hypothetical protein [Mesobacillus foraminis]
MTKLKSFSLVNQSGKEQHVEIISSEITDPVLMKGKLFIQEATAFFEFNHGIEHVSAANLNENSIGKLELANSQVQVKVKTNQVQSILF